MSKLTVITASHNNLRGLMSLYEDIKLALNSDVEWIIKDSGSCVESSNWACEIEDPHIQFYNEKDSGIYNAINVALLKCQSDFYLVVGSDDSVNSSALLAIVKMIQSGKFSYVDVASFPVMINDRIHHKKWMRPVFFSIGGLVSSHSVGTIIRRRLHESVGFYDESYKILADALFLRCAHEVGACFKHFKKPIMGIFTTTGISNTQHARRILEAYSYNVACGDSHVLQAIFMMLRTIKCKPVKFI